MITFSVKEKTTKSCRWFLLMVAAGLMTLCVASCKPDTAPIAESQYSASLAGDWRGTVGDDKETISFQTGGGFTAQLRQMGFISNTLGQGVTGTIRGTWVLKGKVITLTISSSDNEQLLNKTASSTIESFNQNELVLKSGVGRTSTFVRLL